MKTVRTRRSLKISLAATILVGLGGACAQVAGIEDRNFDGTSVAVTSAECEEYCDLVGNKKDAIAAEDANEDYPGVCPQNYTTEDVCLGVCAKLPPGNPDEVSSENTIACRINAARFAKNEADESEKALHCQTAGPGGNGACGSNCEAYCMLVENDDVCGEIAPKLTDCVEKCEAFGDSNRFDVGNSPIEEMDHSGDTVQCRIVHVSTAAKKGVTDADKQTHCPHAAFQSSLWCVPDPPSCERYCDMQEVACKGEHRLYESREQCEATCAELELGEFGDLTGDTIACRTYHAGNSLSNAAEHCAHVGPTGDGHCGHDVPAADDVEAEFAACRPYCRLIEAACPTEFGSTFDDNADCVEECDASDASFKAAKDQKYSVDIAKDAGDTLLCRTFYAVRALGDVPNAADYCPAVFGASPCN